MSEPSVPAVGFERDMTANIENQDVFAGLRRLIRERPRGEERCELCSADIYADHPHLLDIKIRKIMCSCEPCAILFSSQATKNYNRIPRDARLLKGFEFSDSQWDSLAIPINMAFFCIRGGAAQPTAFYPSPAGATESLLSLESWQEIVKQNPILKNMTPEVEALLVNRVTQPHDYYLAPIDECYRLVGLIRSKWRGFSGGTEVWQAIGNFFMSLRERALPIEQTSHAPTELSN